MTQHTHTRLALGGFCLAYAGLMGGLLLVGLPLLEGHRLQVLLYWMLPLTAAGGAIIAVERMRPIDPD
jgi:ABC-type iron transport system FetAB permease component